MISGDRERITVSFPIGVRRRSVSRVQHIGRSSPRLVLAIEIMEWNLYLGEKTLEGHAFESVEDRMEPERHQTELYANVRPGQNELLLSARKATE